MRKAKHSIGTFKSCGQFYSYNPIYEIESSHRVNKFTNPPKENAKIDYF